MFFPLYRFTLVDGLPRFGGSGAVHPGRTIHGAGVNLPGGIGGGGRSNPHPQPCVIGWSPKVQTPLFGRWLYGSQTGGVRTGLANLEMVAS